MILLDLSMAKLFYSKDRVFCHIISELMIGYSRSGELWYKILAHRILQLSKRVFRLIFHIMKRNIIFIGHTYAERNQRPPNVVST